MGGVVREDFCGAGAEAREVEGCSTGFWEEGGAEGGDEGGVE